MMLVEMHCAPLTGNEQPYDLEQANALACEVPAWTLRVDALERVIKFKDFQGAMDFVNRVAAIANAEDHHPDIHISYNKVTLTLSTHKIGGLSKNDFILAAKIDQLM